MEKICCDLFLIELLELVKWLVQDSNTTGRTQRKVCGGHQSLLHLWEILLCAPNSQQWEDNNL